MFTKLIALATLVASVASTDVTVGLPKGGRLAYAENVTASPAIWKQVQTVKVIASEGEVIGRISIVDNRPNKDGEVNITEGGVGEKKVSIELKSPAVFRGLDFTVDVYTVTEEEYFSNETQDTGVVMAADTQVNDGQKNTEQNAETVLNSQPEVQETQDHKIIPVPALTGQETVKTEIEEGFKGLDAQVASVFHPSTSKPLVPVDLSEETVQREQQPYVPDESKVVSTTEEATQNVGTSTVPTTVKTKLESVAPVEIQGQVDEKLAPQTFDQKMKPLPYNVKY